MRMYRIYPLQQPLDSQIAKKKIVYGALERRWGGGGAGWGGGGGVRGSGFFFDHFVIGNYLSHDCSDGLDQWH